MKSLCKHLISLCLSLALLLILFPASQAEAAIRDPSEYLTYTIADGAVTITGCDKTITGSLEIPDTIEGLPVTTIGVGAFGSTSLTELIIPASVVTIKGGSFNTASLTAVSFLGDPPSRQGYLFGEGAWCQFSGTVYYPIHNSKWTIGVLLNLTSMGYDQVKPPIPYVGIHSWDNGTSILDATCTTQGTTVYSCTGCDETKTETAPALGHRWDGGTIISSPTCTQDGLRRYCCTRCDTTKEKTIAATGHQFGAEAWVTQPTCLEDGIKSYTCSVCSFIKYEVAAAEHNAVIDPAVPATCLATGLTEGSHCGTCGEILTAQEVVPVSGHQFQKGVWIKEPTCQENGQKSYTCNTCGFIKYVTFPAEHQYENGTCIHCGELEVLASGNCGDNATWKLDAAGTLTISGSGAMKNYRYGNNGSTSPWDSYCSQIKNVVIQEGITTISNCAFYKCTNLTSVTIPESVTSIGDYAFSDCSSLTTVTIPESVTSIGDYAFRGCSSLTTVTIPEGVTTIGSYTFYNCSSLTDLTIPEGITTIGLYAFCNCSSLTTVAIPKSTTTIDTYAFLKCSSLTAIDIPEGVISIGYGAFADCTGLTNLTIPKSVTEIDMYLFSGCTSLTSITIHENVTSIDKKAFSNCSNMEEIIFLGSAPSLGEDCFNQISVTAYYPCGEDSWAPSVKQDYGGTVTWQKRHLYHSSSVQSATCTENGFTIQSCSGCGYTTVTTIPATGHNFVAGWCEYCGLNNFHGDVTGDGNINMADVARVFAHVRNKNTLTEITAILCADVTGDTKINMADVARIFAHVRGTNPLF